MFYFISTKWKKKTIFTVKYEMHIRFVYNNPMCWKFNILYRQEFFFPAGICVDLLT